MRSSRLAITQANGQPGGGVQHGVVLHGRCEHTALTAGPVDALDREVVALRAAAGEQHLGRPGTQGVGDVLAPGFYRITVAP